PADDRPAPADDQSAPADAGCRADLAARLAAAAPAHSLAAARRRQTGHADQARNLAADNLADSLADYLADSLADHLAARRGDHIGRADRAHNQVGSPAAGRRRNAPPGRAGPARSAHSLEPAARDNRWAAATGCSRRPADSRARIAGLAPADIRAADHKAAPRPRPRPEAGTVAARVERAARPGPGPLSPPPPPPLLPP